MEFSEDKILSISESEDNFSDISFVAPFSPENGQEISMESQVDHLVQEVKKNVWGCDFILCLFIAALNSYRCDRCLRPFPPSYMNGDKNFAALKSTCDSIPPLKTILKEPNECPQDVSKLLMWLFLERGHPVLKRISINSVPFPSKFSSVFKPHFVFEVCYQDKFESLWRQRQDGRETILAYHGSAVDNFYSILKVGLQQQFSLEKEVLFGHGIYLSTELSVSTHYAPFGQTWTNSALGHKHSVIAVCEVINDVEKVKCRDATNKRRSLNDNSFGEIPEKYFVVTDSDMVRVKYLMVYRQRVFAVKSYLARHLCWTVLIVYLISIIAIGLFSNSTYSKSLKKFGHLFSFFD